MVPRPLGRKEPQQAFYYRHRWEPYHALYNNVHYGEPRLHYEIAKASYRDGWEIGFHCEARDKHLNRVLLDGFRRYLFEIKETLGESIEAEMWDRGWTKIYEVYPEADLTTDYQQKIGGRLADIIVCLHPIYVELRSTVAQVYR